MKVGLVLFGNGVYFENNTVSAALQVVQLTSDLEAVRTGVEEMQWQRGFTNMMQAFQAADSMFAEGRDDAQSAVMMLSDGKYTNAFRTGMKAQSLKDKGVQIFMAPIAENPSDELKILRSWSSVPHDTNYERIPGLIALDGNEDVFAQRLLVKFCPRAVSPSQQKATDEAAGYMKIHERGYPDWDCGHYTYLGYYDSTNACMTATKERGVLSFSYSEGGPWHGTCYTESVDVTDEFWNSALNDRANIECPNGGDYFPGGWIPNYYESTYIMNPGMFGDVFGEDE
jgi:hypothetical protein